MKDIVGYMITATRNLNCVMSEIDCIDRISWMHKQYPMLFGWIHHEIHSTFTTFRVTLLHSAN